MLDNQDIAIMTKVDQLAERHGIKPYEFTASVKSVDGQLELAYESVDSQNVAKVEKMVASTGAEDGLVTGDAKHIIDALDKAIAKAPRPRSI